MSAARLRLASRPTLEDLEASHSRQIQSRRLRQPNPETAAVPVARLPREHFHVAQRKYSLDANSPVWKKAVFWLVYIPLFRFFHKRLRFITPDRVEADGSYSWLEHQGCFLTEDEALADAKRYPFGFVVPSPLGRSMMAETTPESAIYYPNKGEKAVPTTDMLSEIDEARQEAAKVRAAVQSARAS
jgi:hypothetical protein